ncbi:MAG: hypothetical protein AAGJ18_04835 [Bacteroidota bacterium]
MRVFTTILLLIFCIKLITAQNSSLLGVFRNDQFGLTISLQGNNSTVSGEYKLQGQSLPITAEFQSDNTIVGSYPYFGNQVPIQLMEVDGSYLLITEGVTIPMTKNEFQNIDNQSSNNEPSSSINVNSPTANRTISKQKANGKIYTAPDNAFQFNLPKDWVAQVLEDGSYLIGHNTKAGFIMVMPHEYNSVAQMQQESVEGIQENGIMLLPSSNFQAYGNNGLIVDFSGTIQGQSVKSNAIGLISPFGGGLTILTAVRSDLYTSKYLTLIQTIANSVTFSKPKVSAAASSWKSRLTNKRLLYMNTSNGFSDKIIIDLCSNGQFGYESNSSGMSGGLSTLTYAGQNGGQGTWKMTSRGQQALLVLSFNNGEVYEYRLSKRESSSQLNLNDRRYFIQEESACY